ncbi:TIGR02453 family protein [Lachnospiraceae bacterium 7_1_58FAA]|nr:TIGR02453 family protein [Lachnospiraceae bacterium 7_1_58FAA]
MFQGFSGATVDFMWGIRFNNEKGWFEAHKEEYLTTFQRPMKALADEVYVAFTDRHPDLDLICKVSRIYRDARRLFGRGPYKDHLWLSLTRPHEEGCAEPVFWFELGPEGYSYGMGFWQAPAVTMAKFRARMDREPKAMEKLARRFQKQDVFVLEGEDYKRPKAAPPGCSPPGTAKRASPSPTTPPTGSRSGPTIWWISCWRGTSSCSPTMNTCSPSAVTPIPGHNNRIYIASNPASSAY